MTLCSNKLIFRHRTKRLWMWFYANENMILLSEHPPNTERGDYLSYRGFDGFHDVLYNGIVYSFPFINEILSNDGTNRYSYNEMWVNNTDAQSPNSGIVMKVALGPIMSGIWDASFTNDPMDEPNGDMCLLTRLDAGGLIRERAHEGQLIFDNLDTGIGVYESSNSHQGTLTYLPSRNLYNGSTSLRSGIVGTYSGRMYSILYSIGQLPGYDQYVTVPYIDFTDFGLEGYRGRYTARCRCDSGPAIESDGAIRDVSCINGYIDNGYLALGETFTPSFQPTTLGRPGLHPPHPQPQLLNPQNLRLANLPHLRPHPIPLHIHPLRPLGHPLRPHLHHHLALIHPVYPPPMSQLDPVLIPLTLHSFPRPDVGTLMVVL